MREKRKRGIIEDDEDDSSNGHVYPKRSTRRTSYCEDSDFTENENKTNEEEDEYAKENHTPSSEIEDSKNTQRTSRKTVKQDDFYEEEQADSNTESVSTTNKSFSITLKLGQNASNNLKSNNGM